MNTSLIGYVLVALLSFCAVSILALALWPAVDLIFDGLMLIGSALAGGK